MAWIRLTDNYDEDEQIIQLSHGAFRLWHQGLAWCRRNETNDGIIPFVIMREFKAFSKTREKELSTAHRPDVQPLWVLIPHVGYRIKSYLKWYPNREQVQKEKDQNAERQRLFRERNAVTAEGRNALLQERRGTDRSVLEKGSGEKPDDPIGERARKLLEELYPAWYRKYRHGARLRLIHNTLTLGDAMTICELWDDERIEKLAQIVLTTDDEWVSKTDRSFKIFVARASWADDRLRQAEAKAAS